MLHTRRMVLVALVSSFAVIILTYTIDPALRRIAVVSVVFTLGWLIYHEISTATTYETKTDQARRPKN